MVKYVGLFMLCVFVFVIATKTQLEGEVRISEKTLEGGEKIEAPKQKL